MGFNEFGTCPFANVNYLESKLEMVSPSFSDVKEKLDKVFPNMVYEDGTFESIFHTLAIKVFMQTDRLCLMVADTVLRLYEIITHGQDLSSRKVKVVLSDRALPLKFSGKFYVFRDEGYMVEVGIINNNIGIHFHLD